MGIGSSSSSSSSKSNTNIENEEKDDSVANFTEQEPPDPVYLQLEQELALLRRNFKGCAIDCPVAVEVLRELKVSEDFFRFGNVMAWEVTPEDPAFTRIHDYVANSQPQSGGYEIKIINILQISPRVTAARDQHVPMKFNVNPETKDKFRMMLWHGTKKQHLTSILQNGLRLPTQLQGNFGAGIYFADRVCKSFQYTDGRISSYLLLCEVMLGEMYGTTSVLPEAIKAPAKSNWWNSGLEVPCDSVKGCGKKVPEVGAQKIVDGCVWPVGKTVTSSLLSTTPMTYNEYIVYNSNQVQIKYLVKVVTVTGENNGNSQDLPLLRLLH